MELGDKHPGKDKQSKRVKEESELWALGFSEGLARACEIVCEQPELVRAIAEEGWRRFGERFDQELKLRKLDLQVVPADEKEIP